MPTDHREKLRNIRTFLQLVHYLRDEMGWPIDTDDFEELTFEYTPEELGIDAANAAKIQEIRRLRPLATGQPWGIFFVKFEHKKLPVVALRRILSRVALKKRASANSAERAAWAANDLLFVSNFGEQDARQISFAHFSHNESKSDLPTLKVLGWDNKDTPLRIDSVVETLVNCLSWPGDVKDYDQWRHKWRACFTLKHGEVVKTSKAMAVRLAELARAIRDRISAILTIETENGPITKLMTALKETLLHDLDPAGFADMYAQTITYGLLSARVTNPKANTVDAFALQTHITNPFIKELMETFLHIGGRRGKSGRGSGIDFDELGVSEVVELLDAANMEAVVRDFGDKNPKEDPVIHFYESFLEEYNAEIKLKRGVFYTPDSVVSYIVKSVDEAIKRDLGLPLGLADGSSWREVSASLKISIPKGVSPGEPFLQILDPAVGTGTFLKHVILQVHKTMSDRWESDGKSIDEIKELWCEYVPKSLLPRIYGFELMMAPYAICHMKIGLTLLQTGYDFRSDTKLNVVLTNTLEPAGNLGRLPNEALAEEARLANKVKEKTPITVVIGNPPYAGHSSNESKDDAGAFTYIGKLIEDYKFIKGKKIKEKNTKWLQDDYVKFMRIIEVMMNKVPRGIVGMITNHSYIDNPTFSGMRHHLLGSYDGMFVLDLHGNLNKKEKAEDGTPDGNIFEGIRQGVAIHLFERTKDRHGTNLVAHDSKKGSAEAKEAYLTSSTIQGGVWTSASPKTPMFFFYPRDERLLEEWNRAVPLTTIFPENVLGFQTHRDYFAVATQEKEIEARVKRLRSSEGIGRIRGDFELRDNRDWHLATSRRLAKSYPDWKKYITRCLYRPHDVRFCYFSEVAMDYPRRILLDHVFEKENICLLSSGAQAVEGFRHTWVTTLPAESCVISTVSKEGNQVFPLYIYEDNPSLFGDSGRRPNITDGILKKFRTILGPQQDSEKTIFYYCYAVISSAQYARRYSSLLKAEFPRVFISESAETITSMAALGRQLSLINMSHELPSEDFVPEVLNSSQIYYGNGPERGDSVQAPEYDENSRVLRVSQNSTIKDVPLEVWRHTVGSFVVAQNWLKDRVGLHLTAKLLKEYTVLLAAVGESIRVTKEIDSFIDSHGGWPIK